MAILMAKLTGASITKPRQPIPYNVWGAANAEIIDQALDARCQILQLSKKKAVNIRSNITRSLFMGLPEAVRSEWEAKAKAEHAKVLADWADVIEHRASTNSEDRQR